LSPRAEEHRGQVRIPIVFFLREKRSRDKEAAVLVRNKRRATRNADAARTATMISTELSIPG